MVYVVAAGVLAFLLSLLWRRLPQLEPQARMGYGQLPRSMWSLLVQQQVLRESCVFGALAFAAFSAFWMTLAFLSKSLPSLTAATRRG